jgi:hypothetical protein
MYCVIVDAFNNDSQTPYLTTKIFVKIPDRVKFDLRQFDEGMGLDGLTRRSF